MADATILINIKDNVTPRLEKLIAKLGSTWVQDVATRAIGSTVKAHLILINGQRANALGGKRTNFYAKAGRSVRMIVGGDHGEVVVVARGFRYQLKGGTIRPSGCLSAITGKPIRHLVIPIHAEAHGRTPSDNRFNGNLFVLRSKEKNQAYLARPKGRGKRKELVFLYVLKASVTKKPDPSVMPTTADLNAAVHTALKKGLRK